MQILSQSGPTNKSGNSPAEPVDHQAERVRRDLAQFAHNELEYLVLRQQFESDLIDAGNCAETRQCIFRAYAWLTKGL